MDTTAEMLTGPRPALRRGMWLAWALVALYAAYIGALFAGGVLRGVPTDPSLAIAEVLTIVGAVLQVFFVAVIHECAPRRRRTMTLVALGWMFVLAGLTLCVHFVMLTAGRQIDPATFPGWARVFGWEWPSLLYAVELAAWHVAFGVSIFFAGCGFQGRGRERVVRYGFRTVGVLCVVGVIGPAVGNLLWRMIGMFGYGVLFPLVCAVAALVFKDAPATDEISSGA